MQMEKDPESMSEKELEKLIKELEKQMKKAAADLNFEAAAELRDKLIELKKTLQEVKVFHHCVSIGSFESFKPVINK